MPVYTHKCERCGLIADRIYTSWKQLCTEPAVRCERDGSRMERIPSAPAFKVEGFNADNHYGAKS